MIALDQTVKSLPGVGPKVVEKLSRLGIKTIEDLVFHLPHRYEDFSNVKKIGELVEGEKATVTAKIIGAKATRTWRRRMMLTEGVLEDGTGIMRAVWFNQPYLAESLTKNWWVALSGKVSLDNTGLYFSNPVFELIGPELIEKEMLHTGKLVPVYSETHGLTSRWLRFKIRSTLSQIKRFDDFLPDFIKKEYKLLALDSALRKIHGPDIQKDYEAARRRLAFDDLFLIQLFTHEERKKIEQQPAPVIPSNIELTKKFVKHLPFTLTDSQRLASWQILKDIEKNFPMNRLLEGDVGSGKTVVAAIAALNVIHYGWQVAYMAPTEILAQQHYKTIQEIFHNFHQEIALLTSTDTKWLNHQSIPRQELLKKISTGEIKLIIGTHALIQKEVEFKNLGLVVVDEQHRFGVEQRAHLLRGEKKKLISHLLSMTATPIPRTLALTLYGDLDLSLLKEMPKGRKKIMTRIIPPAKREDAYGFIRKQIGEGRQAFVICPLIEESKALEVKSVTQEYEKLSKKIFPDLSVAMLHGKMKPKEKEEVMRNFTEGKINILVSTAVVEVGIDVPNATVMMIEGSERFGLAQLHQFRGRVGRGTHQSYCLLFTDSPARATNQRLKALVELNDGFALAEKDLAIRGPGEFFGTQQSGLPDLAMASLKDVKLIEETKAAVQFFFEKSSLEEYPKLKEKLASFTQQIHWE